MYGEKNLKTLLWRVRSCDTDTDTLTHVQKTGEIKSPNVTVLDGHRGEAQHRRGETYYCIIEQHATEGDEQG